MKSAVLRLMLIVLALCTVTGVGLARGAEISGTVQGVDAPSRTVFFTDGRMVTLAPGARFYVGDREVRLADVQPGWVLVTSGSVAASTITTQPGVPAAAVSATGVVTQVDTRSGTITLQDGRVLRVTPGTSLWQPITIGSVIPGTAVFVRNAEPLDFQPAAARPFQMGTVSGVDASRSRVMLSDGTIVQLRPGAQATFNGQPLAISALRVGDEVVVGLPSSGTVSVTPLGAPVSALPREALGVIEADSIYVVRRPQAP
jgi:Cu/Ag efflux protein CusF